jgi:hypothetical protein
MSPHLCRVLLGGDGFAGPFELRQRRPKARSGSCFSELAFLVVCRHMFLGFQGRFVDPLFVA